MKFLLYTLGDDSTPAQPPTPEKEAEIGKFIDHWMSVIGAMGVNENTHPVQNAIYHALRYDAPHFILFKRRYHVLSSIHIVQIAPGDQKVYIEWQSYHDTRRSDFAYILQWKRRNEAWGEARQTDVSFAARGGQAFQSIAHLINGADYEIRIRVVHTPDQFHDANHITFHRIEQFRTTFNRTSGNES